VREAWDFVVVLAKFSEGARGAKIGCVTSCMCFLRVNMRIQPRWMSELHSHTSCCGVSRNDKRSDIANLGQSGSVVWGRRGLCIIHPFLAKNDLDVQG